MGGNRRRRRTSSNNNRDDDERNRLFDSFSRLLEAEVGRIGRHGPTENAPNDHQNHSAHEIEILKLKLELQQKEIEILKQKEELKRTAEAGQTTRELTTRHNAIVFKDIEDSLAKFSGEDSYSLDKWLRDVEEAASAYEWSEIQKVTYGKRLLTGNAKVLLRTTGLITTWDDLVNLLKQEFQPTVNSARIHRMMAERKKLASESFKTYLICMRELGATGSLDDVTIIHYIIDGIPDDQHNKAILYGSRNMEEFREKLSCYEEIKRKSTPLKTSSNAFRPSVQSNRLDYRNKRCHTCGATGHGFKKCPNQGKGAMCYKCKEFGHYANKCPSDKVGIKSSGSGSEKKEAAAVVKSGTSVRNIKEVAINNNKIHAMIDSGSDINLVSLRKLSTIGGPKVERSSLVFNGIGSKDLRTVGHIKVKLTVDGDTYDVLFHVFEDSLLSCDVILGREFLQQTVTVFSPESVSITRYVPEVAAVVVDSTIELDVEHLSNREYANEIKSMVVNYQPQPKVVSDDIQMHIVLTERDPIYQRPRRLAPLELQIVRSQIDEWLEEEIVRPSKSEYASPVVLANKKDGSKRLCIDYRKLNKSIVKDRYPMPLIDDQIDKLQSSKFFSTLDLRNGFFHVRVAEDSTKYTAFVVPFGQYEFLRAPFGLCNSPAVFQRFVNNIFRELSNEQVVCVYMDDIIIPSRNEREGIDRLRRVMHIAEINGLQIKWPKCQFLKTNVEYLGYEIEDGSIRPSKSKQQAILRFPEPRSVKQLQQFLGLTGYFRRFVDNYSGLAKPLSDLLRKDVQFQFGLEQRTAMEKLKTCLTSEPVLQIYSPTALTEVHTDACKIGLGAVLLQEKAEDGKLHPVFYYSRKTTKCEEKYSSYELEVLAIVSILKKWRTYLLGIEFKLVTDCSAFKGTMERKELTSRIAGWALQLQEFKYKLEHRSATKMRHVDALSRGPVVMVVSQISNQVKAAQKDDDRLNCILQLLDIGEYENYLKINGVLFKVEKGEEKLVVPRTMQYQVIRMFHEQGHFGVQKTQELVEREYYFDEMKKKVTSVIKNCIKCIMVNKVNGKKDGLLHPIPKGVLPLDTYHVDHMGHLTASRKQYQHVLCVVDGFSKFVWLYPTKTTSTREVISKLESQRSVFGNPRCIISDRGTAFTSSEFTEYCKNENIVHHVTTTGMPSGNGQAERINRIVISVLAKLSYEKPDEWYKYVGEVQQHLNNTLQKSTNKTPFELMVGTKMKIAQDLRIYDTIEREAAELFCLERDELRQAAGRQIQKAQEEYRSNFNKRRSIAPKYVVGDWVVIKKTQYGSAQKIGKKFMGPYQVTKVRDHDRYDVVKVDQAAEGPRQTSSGAENMRLFCPGIPFDNSDDDEEEVEVEDEKGATDSKDSMDSTEASEFLGFEDDEDRGQPGRLPSRMAE